jgi:predicted DNA-binding protein (MmcQ/YjbR family)
MARNHWVSLTQIDALRRAETQELIRSSYELVLGKLPRKLQSKLSIAPATARSTPNSKPAARRKK